MRFKEISITSILPFQHDNGKTYIKFLYPNQTPTELNNRCELIAPFFKITEKGFINYIPDENLSDHGWFNITSISVPICGEEVVENERTCIFHLTKKKKWIFFDPEDLLIKMISRDIIPSNVKSLTFKFGNGTAYSISIDRIRERYTRSINDEFTNMINTLFNIPEIEIISMQPIDTPESERIKNLEKQLEVAKKTTNSGNIPKCGVCCTANANALQKKCGHIYMCMPCASMLEGKPCPICRSPNSKFKELIYSC